MWGWEPTTTYEYDDDGRLISSRPEPEWDDEQRHLAIAHYELEALTGSYGEYLPEALSAGADPNNPDGTIRYIVGTNNSKRPKINWAAKALHDAQESFYKEFPNAPRTAHHWAVTRYERPTK